MASSRHEHCLIRYTIAWSPTSNFTAPDKFPSLVTDAPELPTPAQLSTTAVILFTNARLLIQFDTDFTRHLGIDHLPPCLRFRLYLGEELNIVNTLLATSFKLTRTVVGL
jgi:hypothetical protein